MDGSLSSALGVGFLLGLRHALDADHVAAVSTFVSQRRGLVGSCVLGTFWGIGHTAALLLAAAATTLLQLRIPPEADRTLEALVAIVIVALGANVVRQAIGSVRVHRHEHVHDGRAHRHLHVHVGSTAAHTHGHRVSDAGRPLVMGALHGLAGSAAVLLLVVAAMPSTLAALVYVAVFGIGSTLGMALVSGLVGIPFTASGSTERFRRLLQMAVGVGSVGVGVVMLGSLTAG